MIYLKVNLLNSLAITFIHNLAYNTHREYTAHTPRTHTAPHTLTRTSTFYYTVVAVEGGNRICVGEQIVLVLKFRY